MEGFDAVGFAIFGISGYTFCVAVGLAAGVAVFFALLSAKGLDLDANAKSLAVSGPVGLVCAEAFGVLSGMWRDIGQGRPITWHGDEGIVWWGGLLGLLACYALLARWRRQDPGVMDLLATGTALFHSIARIGCFVGGCCYGVESDGPLAVTYTCVVDGAVETARRVPIQLIESGFEACLFLYLLGLARSDDWREKGILRRYLFVYAAMRIVLELFRGDADRGVAWGVSFSQMVSALVLLALAIGALRRRWEGEQMNDRR